MVRLGIDLGGTNIAVGVVNEQNEIIGTASVKTNAPRPAEEIADSMREACLLALGEARMTLDDVASVGVGTPGVQTGLVSLIVKGRNFPRVGKMEV